jgi:hypothetical protein
VLGFAFTTNGNNYGIVGTSSSPIGSGVRGYASTATGINDGVLGKSAATIGHPVEGLASATIGTNFGVYGTTFSSDGYGICCVGGLAGTGTKSAIVATKDYGWRSLYAIESPQNWFEDFGKATLTAGEAMVTIDSIFAQTVNLERPYHVFLTPMGDCGLYVAVQTAASLTGHALNDAACNIDFHYRIIAPRLDYEDLRLKPAADPQALEASLPETK